MGLPTILKLACGVCGTRLSMLEWKRAGKTWSAQEDWVIDSWRGLTRREDGSARNRPKVVYHRIYFSIRILALTLGALMIEGSAVTHRYADPLHSGFGFMEQLKCFEDFHTEICLGTRPNSCLDCLISAEFARQQCRKKIHRCAPIRRSFRKRVSISNCLAMKFTARMLYYY